MYIFGAAEILPYDMNKEQFEDLYNNHWDKLFAFCLNYTNDPHISKGLVQNIFISIWERREELSIQGAAENYLFRAAKLKVAEYFRNKAIRRTNLEKATVNQATSKNNIEDFIYFNELKNRVKEIVSKLPPQCKLVYTLSREGGLKNSEIANQMSLAEKTVENHLTRALNTLRSKL